MKWTSLRLHQQGLWQQELRLVPIVQFKHGHGQTTKIWNEQRKEDRKRCMLHDTVRHV